MTKATEQQFAEWNRETIEAALKLAKASAENAEKLARLQLDSMRALLEESFENARELAEIKDPQQFAARRAKMLEKNVARMADYSRRIYELASATQSEFSTLMETHFTSLSRDLGQLVESAARTAPAGSEPATAVLRQTLAASKAMVDTMARAARQFTHLAETNITSATAPAKGGAKKRA